MNHTDNSSMAGQAYDTRVGVWVNIPGQVSIGLRQSSGGRWVIILPEFVILTNSGFSAAEPTPRQIVYYARLEMLALSQINMFIAFSG